MTTKSKQEAVDQKPEQDSSEEKPPMNLLEATGVAVYKNVDDSTINKPEKGEAKRSFRLIRLLLVMALTVAGFIIVIALLAYPMAGWLKLFGIIIFLAFTTRCAYVSFMLWKKLK